MTITHFNAAHKSVCVEALKCVMNSLPQIRATCHGIANHALDMGATCLDIQKELEVYKNIMNNHSENFSKASTLISEIKPMISKFEQCNFEFATSGETLNRSQLYRPRMFVSSETSSHQTLQSCSPCLRNQCST